MNSTGSDTPKWPSHSTQETWLAYQTGMWQVQVEKKLFFFSISLGTG